MTATFALLIRDPALRLVTLLLFLIGAFAGTVGPYTSLLGVKIFGLGDAGFAAVLVIASTIGVASAIVTGIVTDQRANRRAVALTCTAATVIGVAAVCLHPGATTYVFAHALMLPLGAATYGQVFALARLAASGRPQAERDAILTTVRALFALPFILVLPILSFALRQGLPVQAIYPVLLVLAVTIFVLVWRQWPRDGQTKWADQQSGLSFRAAFREIWHPAVAIRVALIGILSSGSTLYMSVTGLIFTTVAGRSEGDVALFVGAIAGLEVPVMLMTPWMLRHFSKTVLMATGAAIFAVHLTLIAPLAPTPFIWLLILPAAFGGAIYLAVPIAYLQDLMADRPGAGSSLLALQKIAGDAACASAFVAGTALSGYGLAAIFGATLAVLAGLVLVWIDRMHQSAAKKSFGA